MKNSADRWSLANAGEIALLTTEKMVVGEMAETEKYSHRENR
jgi:hypothetical protein